MLWEKLLWNSCTLFVFLILFLFFCRRCDLVSPVCFYNFSGVVRVTGD